MPESMHTVIYYAPAALAVAGFIAFIVHWRRDNPPVAGAALLLASNIVAFAIQALGGRWIWAALSAFGGLVFAWLLCRAVQEVRFRRAMRVLGGRFHRYRANWPNVAAGSPLPGEAGDTK